MHTIIGHAYAGKLTWTETGDEGSGDSGVIIIVRLWSGATKREALLVAAESIQTEPAPWMLPAGELDGPWVVKLEILRRRFASLSDSEWLSGEITVQPEVRQIPDQAGARIHGVGSTDVVFVLAPGASFPTVLAVPDDVAPSLGRFRRDHPNPRAAAFVMMRFDTSPVHNAIFKAIEDTLAQWGITALRADHCAYSDDLFLNVQAYMHGCAIGIAVFERLKEEVFNPNVSLEVGYMMAQGKPVCLLKDMTIRALQSDLVGKLYVPFDTQGPDKSIPPALAQWLRSKRLIPK